MYYYVKSMIMTFRNKLSTLKKYNMHSETLKGGVSSFGRVKTSKVALVLCPYRKESGKVERKSVILEMSKSNQAAASL